VSFRGDGDLDRVESRFQIFNKLEITNGSWLHEPFQRLEQLGDVAEPCQPCSQQRDVKIRHGAGKTITTPQRLEGRVCKAVLSAPVDETAGSMVGRGSQGRWGKCAALPTFPGCVAAGFDLSFFLDPVW
jgi:hypothetical protein